MNVQDLKTLESIKITEGTGGSLMHIIKHDKNLYVTRDDEMKKLEPDSEHEINREIYQHFVKMDGEKANTREVLENFRKNSHDWYSLLLCEMLIRDLDDAKN